MRLRKIPAARSYLENAANVMILDAETSMLLEHNKTQQVELEIGCGKGDFIIARAQANKDVQYYALEKYDSVLYKAVQKAEGLELDNLTFILGDAVDLAQLFQPQSIATIYLNFSDPWPKIRHAKRRLTHTTKLALYRDLLAPTGVLEMKTDNADLFAFSLEMLADVQWALEDKSNDLYGADMFTDVKAYQTEYEKKFIKRGQPIHYLRTKPAVEKKKADKIA